MDLPRICSDLRVTLKTGGHAGIGLATTRLLARSGARVIIASRTPSKVEEAIKQLTEEDAGFANRLSFVQLDLSRLSSAKEAAAAVLQREDRLDGVVCNAGVMASPYELTSVSTNRHDAVTVFPRRRTSC